MTGVTRLTTRHAIHVTTGYGTISPELRVEETTTTRATMACVRELSAGECEMGNAAGRTGCLNLEPLLKILELVP